jgi:hypothetical protein
MLFCPKGSAVKLLQTFVGNDICQRPSIYSSFGQSSEVNMKRLLNLAVAAGLVLGTANAASAASLQSLYNRYVAPTIGTPYIGGSSSYGYSNPYYSGYGYGNVYSGYGAYNPYTNYNYTNPYTSYYGLNTGYGYNPYYGNPYGYNYNTSGSTSLRGIGNLLLNWF